MQKNFIVRLFYVIIKRSLILIHFYTTKKISLFTNFYFDNINAVHDYDRDFIMII